MGKLTSTTNGTMAALGGTSYALKNNLFINYKNPASYTAFDSLSFIGDAAFFVSFGNLKTAEQEQRADVARFGYLTIGLPVTKHWRTSVGIIPFSDIGYNIIDKKEDRSYSYVGEGGLMQLYWGNAFKLYKELSFGLNVSYLFGSMNNIRYAEYTGEHFLNSRIARNNYINGICFTAGLQYFTDINANHRLGFGLVYDRSVQIWVKENLLINNYLGVYDNSAAYDTVLYQEGNKGRMVLPQSVGFGMSYFFANKLLIGADVTWQNWNNYKMMGHGDSLIDAIVVNVGVQFTPNAASNKYFKRINFRLGAKYSTGYLNLNDTPLPEMAVTFGLGFPFRSFTSQSSLHIMFEYGQMGTTAHGLINQNYFKVQLNFILHEKWYQRTKLE
jgi:hypothetical protein